MRVSATAKYLRGSTRKTRLVTQAIKGKRVEDATAILRFMPQKAAAEVARVGHLSDVHRPHHRGLQRQEAHPGLRDREHGRPSPR